MDSNDNTIITTQGIVYLTDQPAVLQADGLPDTPTRGKVALLYPGVFTLEDTMAELVGYRRWMDSQGQHGHYWVAQMDTALAEQPAAERALALAEHYRDLLDAALAAIEAETDLPEFSLPDPDDKAGQELAKIWSIFSHFPTDLLHEAGGEIVEMITTNRDRWARTASHWQGTIQANASLVDAVHQIIATQETMLPPWERHIHDGTHIIDLPECYSIGQDRTDKACLWIN